MYEAGATLPVAETSDRPIPSQQPGERAVTHGKGDVPGPLAWLSARQRDLCMYCGCETWLPWERRREPRLREAWDLPASRSLGCQIAFAYRMASVEHLRRRADGGADAPSNLAMACAFCNSTRRKRTPSAHAAAMRELKQGGRHPCFPG